MAAQAGLCLAWSEAPEDMFCRVLAHIYVDIDLTILEVQLLHAMI